MKSTLHWTLLALMLCLFMPGHALAADGGIFPRPGVRFQGDFGFWAPCILSNKTPTRNAKGSSPSASSWRDHGLSLPLQCLIGVFGMRKDRRAPLWRRCVRWDVRD